MTENVIAVIEVKARHILGVGAARDQRRRRRRRKRRELLNSDREGG